LRRGNKWSEKRKMEYNRSEQLREDDLEVMRDRKLSFSISTWRRFQGWLDIFQETAIAGKRGKGEGRKGSREGMGLA